MRPASLALYAVAGLLMAGSSCAFRSHDQPSHAEPGRTARGGSSRHARVAAIAPGVRYRAISADDPLTGGSPVWLIEADLGVRGVAVGIAWSGLRESESPRYGDCRTADMWCAIAGTVAAVNGGYFGQGDEERKEIVGLLVGDGMVLSSGSQRRGSRGPYVRSVFGIGRDGAPGIRWATGRRGMKADLAWYADPEQAQASGRWPVREAVGCGPTLVVSGKVRVTDREERLVSHGRLPRTFVAYSVRSGRPDRFVMAVGQTMEYADAAAFIAGYFRREHDAECERAMCLDGGGSSQLAYVAGGQVETPVPAFVTVPTAIIVRAKPEPSNDP